MNGSAESVCSSAGVTQLASNEIDTARIRARAIEVLGDSESAEHWLRTPIRSIGGVAPGSLLDSADGRQLVLDTLGRIEQGIAA
jgi:putative toxin-antitoxin system antitoxin component (TIGR02293 family)